MHQSDIHLRDLPNEILIIILKKLDNIDVPYSLFGINNKRLDILIEDDVYVYSKSEYTLESVSVSVRPAVYTITLHNYIRLCWNFVHRIVSSYLGRVQRLEWSIKKWLSYRKNCHYWPDHPWGGGFFQKTYFSQNYFKTHESTQFLKLIPNMILVLNQTVVF
jgi:hypothetical protein